MKKSNTNPKGKKHHDQAQDKPKSVTQLTEQEMEQVQGGQSIQKNGFRRTKEKKQPKPEKGEGMIELTDQNLEQVQGEFDDDTTGSSFVKTGPDGDDDDERKRRRRREIIAPKPTGPTKSMES